MGNIRLRRFAPLLLPLAFLACGMADGAPDGGILDEPPLDRCSTDSDCPTGLICTQSACVAEDGLPPEQPDPRTFLPPASSTNFVFALSPEASAVAVIDPARARVDAIPLPAEPVDLRVIPGEDSILALSRSGAAVSLLRVGDGAPRLEILPVGRRLSNLSLAPDASWAVAWTRDGEPLDGGAEGLLLLIDVASLREETPTPPLERVAGRRHSHVFFRSEAGVAADVVVVGKDELAVFDLGDPAARSGAERILLPPAFAELATRRVVASSDGAFVLLASIAEAELLVLDVEARSLGRLPLPAPPSDLAVSPDGAVAVAPLRASSQTAFFPLPAALADPGQLRVVTTALPGAACESPGCLVGAGQARLAPDGSFALLFTSAQPSRSLGRLDLATGAFAVLDRIHKEVQTVSIASDGAHAIVLHRPQKDSTAADPYERAADRAEGYSVVKLDTGIAQLVLTGDVPPRDAVFAPGSRHAAVTLRNDLAGVFRVDAIELETLVSTPLPLASAPEFAGPLAPDLADEIWVTQAHAAGRISFVDLASRTTRTVTGFELNGAIE